MAKKKDKAKKAMYKEKNWQLGFSSKVKHYFISKAKLATC